MRSHELENGISRPVPSGQWAVPQWAKACSSKTVTEVVGAMQSILPSTLESFVTRRACLPLAIA